ncbi:YheC/YheD family protein [Paenibacillus sp. OAS669]|uniref:YheC/YheD family protein n=1 Tax=Paenibacillus sp. OAS669 TaxID=2663821 RepID=UPI0019F7822F|nr:YheC/YheD family protein [Paenibacillus sp. OAS669]MBE1442245.1 glutathione synthase/RimK-type ligase-like ATP-grasp enzyme [Paenibacillus sp. OAS669]
MFESTVWAGAASDADHALMQEAQGDYKYGSNKARYKRDYVYLAIRGKVDVMSKKYNRFVVSKWTKTCVLSENTKIRAHIPPTEKMTHSSLKSMLDKYRMVYIKPDKGTFGIGVMRVEVDSDASKPVYRYQSGSEIRKFASYDDMYDSIIDLTKNRLYLVQMGIHLTKYLKRSFDIRVHVQQSPQKKWETTGIIGRVADPKKIVTNVHNGGQIKSIETLLKAYLPADKQKIFIRYLKKLGLVTAEELFKTYKGIKEVGLDIALDKDLKPWILEVNTNPDPYIFNRLKDKTMYRKVYRYAKAYGRV